MANKKSSNKRKAEKLQEAEVGNAKLVIELAAAKAALVAEPTTQGALKGTPAARVPATWPSVASAPS